MLCLLASRARFVLYAARSIALQCWAVSRRTRTVCEVSNRTTGSANGEFRFELGISNASFGFGGRDDSKRFRIEMELAAVFCLFRPENEVVFPNLGISISNDAF